MGFTVDIHNHCSELSKCGRSTAEEMCRGAITYGINALCFTDHNKYMPLDQLAALRAAFPELWLIRGIEVGVIGGEDIVVLGVEDPALEKPGMEYADLHAIVREQNGFMSLAHPFRYHPTMEADIDTCPPDTIEIHSRNTGACNAEKIQAMADRIGVPVIHVSDAHWDTVVGIYHVELPERPATEQDLFAELRKGAYTLRGDEERIAARNREVDEIEDEIRELIAEGLTPEEYEKRTGKGNKMFDRVYRGESWRI